MFFQTLASGNRSAGAAYIARVNAAGGSVTSEGATLINSVLANASSQSLTIERGYLFGTAVNLPGASREVMELTGNGQSLFADSVANDSVLVAGKGSLLVKGNTNSQGYLKTTSDSLFTNSDWTILFFGSKPIVDSTNGAQVTCYMSQMSNPSTNGHFYVLGDQTGGISFFQRGSAAGITIRAGGQNLEAPYAYFLTYVSSTRTLVCYDAFERAQAGSTAVLSQDFAALATYVGGLQSGGVRPNLFSSCALLKFNSVLTNGQMDSVWDNLLNNCLVDIALIYGNSVTAGSDSQGAGSNVGNGWSWVFARSAIEANTYCVRPPNMGAKDLWYYRPATWTKPGSTLVNSYPAYSANDSIDRWKKWKPTVFVMDENQNTANYPLVDYSIDYANILDQMVADLRVQRSTCKFACGTQMALWAKDTNSPFGSLTYAQVAASAWRTNLKNWSASIRADSRYNAVFDTYTALNLGWGSSDDGNAANPTTDLPNGDPTLFYDDAQHPNSAGHALIAAAAWSAVSSIKLHG